MKPTVSFTLTTSEGPWGRAVGAARMAASYRAGFLDSDRGFSAAAEDANVGSKPERGQGMPGGGLTCECEGKARRKGQPWSRTGENSPYGILGGTMETSASFEARSAPSSYPTD